MSWYGAHPNAESKIVLSVLEPASCKNCKYRARLLYTWSKGLIWEEKKCKRCGALFPATAIIRLRNSNADLA